MRGRCQPATMLKGSAYGALTGRHPPYASSIPAVTVVSVVSNRAWTDSNHNNVVDCNLLNPALQDNTATGGDICAAGVGNQANFGKVGAATIVNPNVLHGWGKRPGDYQWAATLQHEIVPRVSAEVSYTRRTFFGFLVTY